MENIIVSQIVSELTGYINAGVMVMLFIMFIAMNASVVFVLIDTIDAMCNIKLLVVYYTVVYDVVCAVKRLISQVYYVIAWYIAVHIIVTY